jgi:O-methyltransferase
MGRLTPTKPQIDDVLQTMTSETELRLLRLLPRLYGHGDTLYETFNLTERVASLEGDIVECGIAMGAQLAAMKLAAPHKLAWGYDSFQGIQLAGRHDDVQPGKEGTLDLNRALPDNLLVSSGVTSHARKDVEAHLKEWGFTLDGFRLVEGWIQNTVIHPENQPDKIAILRLDMDVHDPTLVALKFLWPKLVTGGILIIDDWGYSGIQTALKTFFKAIDYWPQWQTPKHTGWLVK